jgi:hypothetical protein
MQLSSLVYRYILRYSIWSDMSKQMERCWTESLLAMKLGLYHVIPETQTLWCGNTVFCPRQKFKSHLRVYNYGLWSLVCQMNLAELPPQRWDNQCCLSLQHVGQTKRSCSKKETRMPQHWCHHHPPWHYDTPHSLDGQTVVLNSVDRKFCSIYHTSNTWNH